MFGGCCIDATACSRCAQLQLRCAARCACRRAHVAVQCNAPHRGRQLRLRSAERQHCLMRSGGLTKHSTANRLRKGSIEDAAAAQAVRHIPKAAAEAPACRASLLLRRACGSLARRRRSAQRRHLGPLELLARTVSPCLLTLTSLLSCTVFCLSSPRLGSRTAAAPALVACLIHSSATPRATFLPLTTRVRDASPLLSLASLPPHRAAAGHADVRTRIPAALAARRSGSARGGAAMLRCRRPTVSLARASGRRRRRRRDRAADLARRRRHAVLHGGRPPLPLASSPARSLLCAAPAAHHRRLLRPIARGERVGCSDNLE